MNINLCWVALVGVDRHSVNSGGHLRAFVLASVVSVHSVA